MIYTEETKTKCLSELMDGKSLNDVARDNYIARATLLEWKNSFRDRTLYSQLIKERDEYKDKYNEALTKLIMKERIIELLEAGDNSKIIVL